MAKLRLELRENAGSDSRPRWLMVHSIVITEDMSEQMLTDTLEILQRRINSFYGRV